MSVPALSSFTPLTDDNRIVQDGKGRQMSLYASRSSANDLALLTTSTPAGHKRSAGRQRQSRRPLKKRRVMPVQVHEEEEGEHDSSKSSSKDLTGSKGFIARVSGLLRTFSISNRSNAGPSSAMTTSSSSKAARDDQPEQSMYEGPSRTTDMTIEPEDDTLFPSRFNIPQSLPSTSSLQMDGSTITRRREPLYNAEVSVS